MRKFKSVLAIFIGFCFWQLLRQFIPGLEVHPIFIYIYGMIEIRETSEKMMDYGKMRIMATFTAIGVGLPFMILFDWLKPLHSLGLQHSLLEISILLLGVLVTLCVAEWVGCKVYCCRILRNREV